MNYLDETMSEFLLFIAGESPQSNKAVHSFEELQKSFSHPDAHFKIVDIFKEPQLAEEFKVLATPTLIRIKPHPSFRLIGDFSNINQLAEHLGLKNKDF